MAKSILPSAMACSTCSGELIPPTAPARKRCIFLDDGSLLDIQSVVMEHTGLCTGFYGLFVDTAGNMTEVRYCSTIWMNCPVSSGVMPPG